MPRRVEHDPDVLLRLETGLAGAERLRVRDRLAERGDPDVEVCACICWWPGPDGHTGGTWSASNWQAR